MNRIHSFRLPIVVVVLGLCIANMGLSDGGTFDRSSAEQLQKAQVLFDEFVRNEADLATGSCVENAKKLYNKFKDARLDMSKVRMILMLREPEPVAHMPQLMIPNIEYLRGSMADEKWIWHSFLVMDGVVYDPKYTGDGHSLKKYLDSLWSRDPERDNFLVYSLTPDRLPEFQGRSYSTRKPNFLRFQAVHPADLVADPLFVTPKEGERVPCISAITERIL